MTAMKLAWRLQRWELALSIAALLILTVGALVTPMTTLLGSAPQWWLDHIMGGYSDDLAPSGT